MIKKIRQALKSADFNLKEEIREDSEIRGLPGWDSLKHLKLLLAVEKKFNVEIPPQKISSVIFVKDLINIINHGHSGIKKYPGKKRRK